MGRNWEDNTTRYLRQTVCHLAHEIRLAPGQGLLKGSCENSNETLGFTKNRQGIYALVKRQAACL